MKKWNGTCKLSRNRRDTLALVQVAQSNPTPEQLKQALEAAWDSIPDLG
jgi:hypothetical protein